MYVQLSTIRRVGIAAVLAVFWALPVSVWAAPPEKNPGQPFAEILAQIVILNDKIKAFPRHGKTGPCDMPPVWGKKFPGANRFVAVLDGAAYCDQETGLVWERSPAGVFDWIMAIAHCANREVGGRKGWSLPMREQLASLVDRTGTGVDSNGNPVKLPDGHPFKNVQSFVYWSATTLEGDPQLAWHVGFVNGRVFFNVKDAFRFHAWCVRGGQSFDGNTHETLH
jgi:hypothetical protein